MDPCPKCGKNNFSSSSGRTLHIKGCKGDLIATRPNIPPPKPKAEPTEPTEKSEHSPEYEAMKNRTMHILPVLVLLPKNVATSEIIARFKNKSDAKIFVAASKDGAKYVIDDTM